MRIVGIGWLCSVIVVHIYARALDDPDDSSCTQIDFDEATLTSLAKCDYMQEFIVKRYDDSEHFDPFRPEAAHFLSNKWQGLTCGETVRTYSFNEDTELRMAYNLIFDSGATLEVRVFDLDRLDPDGKPTLVEVWRTTSSTDEWGLFRERLNKTVKQAKIQIEANINAGSNLAIEYLTIFNYEVETEECSALDEFGTTTTTEAVTTTTEENTTETSPITTSTLAATTETTTMTTTTTTTTTTEIVSTTVYSTERITTTTATEVSDEPSTISLASTSTVATSTTTGTMPLTTTTTNAPRDDTSSQSFTSTPPVSSSSTPVVQTTDSVIVTTQGSTPPGVGILTPKRWLWMTLTALFAVLFVFAASAAIYLCYANHHLNRIVA